MFSPFSRIFLLCTCFLTWLLASCQATDPVQSVSPVSSMKMTFNGINGSQMPDSVTWTATGGSPKSGKAAVIERNADARRLVVSVATPTGLKANDTVWLSFWKEGVLFSKRPYQLLDDSTLHALTPTKDNVALHLFLIRDSLAETDSSSSLAQVYARQLLLSDASVAGFPENCPTGISAESVRRFVVFLAVSQGRSASSLSSFGIDEAAAAAIVTSLTLPSVQFSIGQGIFDKAQSLELSNPNTAASIHYTTDGTLPTPRSPRYGTAIAIASTTTVKAIAVLAGMFDSPLAQGRYEIDLTLTPVAMPSISPASGSHNFAAPFQVSISTTTDGAQIHFTTDESAPTAASPVYSAPFTVGKATTVKAIAIKAGMANSGIATATYTLSAIPKASPPTLTASTSFTGSMQVTMSSTEAAQIHYTTDGNAPSSASPVYSTPISISATTTVKAIAVKTGMTTSDVATATYTLSAIPKASPPTLTASTSFTGSMQVTMSSTEAAQIHYTTDGNAPSSASPVYSTPISISATTTVKAIAVKTGMTTSDVATATYTQLAISGQFADDRDKEVYTWVQIGSQKWMAQNLRYKGYWWGADSAGRWYNNKISTFSHEHGRLYTWVEALDIQTDFATTAWTPPTGNHKGLCPKGWHVPTAQEWRKLLAAVDSTKSAVALKATTNWTSRTGVAQNNGQNSAGFNAFGTGMMTMEKAFYDQGFATSFWTTGQPTGATEQPWAYSCSMDAASTAVVCNNDYSRKYALSLRCVAD